MAKGTVALFVVFLAFIGAFVFFYGGSKRGKQFHMRRIAGISAIDEAVGRCTEMGRPVHYCFGVGKFDASIVASLNLLSYVAKQCAEMGTQIIVSNAQAEVQQISEGIVRWAFADAGRKDLFRPENVRFLTDTPMAYGAAVFGILHRENPGANLMFGPFAVEGLLISEVGNRLGLVQIAGTNATGNIPTFVATCDYALLGDELFTAGAYLSGDPQEMGSALAQDVVKVGALALVLIGSVLASFGNNVIGQLLLK